MTSAPQRCARPFARAAYGAVVGGFIGGLGAAAVIAVGRPCLEGAGGALIAYAVALAVASTTAVSRTARAGARPIAASAVLVVFLVIAARRWWTAWLNLEALGWGSGPAGELAAVVFPLVGAIAGAAFEADSASASA
jgi:hypothetical protein